MKKLYPFLLLLFFTLSILSQNNNSKLIKNDFERNTILQNKTTTKKENSKTNFKKIIRDNQKNVYGDEILQKDSGFNLYNKKETNTSKSNKTTTNTSVANAILVNQSPFFDQNININEAPTSNGGFGGCNVAGFNIIYYKFTAEADGNANAFLYDQSGNANDFGANSSFVIFYTAANLNAASESDLTSYSDCSFGTSTNVTITKDTTYYIAIYRQGTAKTNISIRIPLDVSDEEKTIISDLYNSTNGDNWLNNANWNSEEPVSNWHGIIVKDGHINTIKLGDNNLEGNLPESIIDLSELKNIEVYSNKLSGSIPNLTMLNLESLWIENNLYEFGNLEPNFNYYNTNISDFWYSLSIKPDINLNESNTVTIGDNRELSVDTSGTNNIYTWYKGNIKLGESTDGKWNLENIQIADFGSYTCNITNSLVVNTTIGSNEILIGDDTDPSTTADYNTLVDIYNSMNGDNWTDNSNWLSAEPLYKWKGITIDANYRVLELKLSSNNLSGSIPNSIGNLSQLEYISLSFNNITGAIPSSIGNLTNLKELYLNFTQLSESIPKEIGNITQLTRLQLRYGNLSGNIPLELGNLTNLEHLYIQNQQISGGIPKELGDLNNCLHLVLWNNELTGEIPKELGNLSKATLIYLDDNQLTGTIPNEITSLTSLLTFNADNNSLSGNVPNFSNNIIETFSIFNNNFIFSDLETNHSNNTSIDSYQYNPQNKLSEDETTYLKIGENITLDATIAGSNNQYQWYKNNVLVNGETNPILNLTNIQLDELGEYQCKVTHPTITDLELQTGIYSIRINNEDHPDYNALVALYNSTRGVYWTNNTNWLDPNSPINTWFGVTLENGRVSEISLDDNNTYPDIPEEVGELIELKSISITNVSTSYSGGKPLPATICNLTKIEYFSIYGLGVTGDFPSLATCNIPNLYWFDIRNNNFTGQVPQEVVTLPNIVYFLVSNNQFSGILPDFSNISSLRYLNIDNNNFQFGDFENEFSNYTNNSNLNFSYSPQKEIPAPDSKGLAIGESFLFNSNVSGADNIYWWVKRNSQGGGTVISNDKDFTLTINSAADYGEYYLEVASNIVSNLLLSSPNFVINEPASNHPDYNTLVALYNSTNGDNWTNSWDLTAPISSWYGLTFNVNDRIEIVRLGGNNLTGSLPPEIGNLITLTEFHLWDNNISGIIPKEIGNLTNLIELDLALNNLNGEIPQEIGNLINLEVLYLNDNNFSGQLPASLLNLTKLKWLFLLRCNYEGVIPDFSVISTLEILDIRENFYDFTDLEPLVSSININDFRYSPQQTRDTAIETTIASGESITITVDDQGVNKTGKQKNADGNVYTWYKNNEIINGEASNTLVLNNVTENDNGIYYCEITNPALPDLTIRRATVTITVDTTASLENENVLENVSIYPNPTNNKFTIKLQKLENTKIVIYDVNGKQVLKKNFKTKQDEINISNLKSGVYILSITSNNKSISKRLIKI